MRILNRILPLRCVTLCVMLLTLAACGGGSATTVSTNPTRGPLPTVAAQPWRILGGTISRATAEQIKPIGALLAHQATVNRMTFSADSHWLLSVDATGVAILWDLETGRQVRRVSQPVSGSPGDEDARFAFFNADTSEVVVITGAGTIRFSARNSGQILAEVIASPDGIQWADWSADGSMLATGDQKGVLKTWDLQARKLLQTLGPATGPIRIVRLSPHGEAVAALTTDDKAIVVRVWDVPAATPEKARGEIREFQAPPRTLQFSPDGKLLAAGARFEAQVYNTADLTRRYRLTGEELMSEAAITFSPDGKLFAALGLGEFVYVWQAGDGTLIAALPRHEKAASGLAFSPDSGLLLTTVSRPGAYLWPVDSFGIGKVDFPRGTIALEGSGYLGGAWSPDGKRLILAEASGALLAYGIPNAP